MSRKNPYNRPIKNRLFRVINAFERWYYALSFGVRHVVGVLLLLSVFAGVFGITYGAYVGLHSGFRWIADQWYEFWKSDDDSDEYSGNESKHFDFPLAESEMHPKRRPNYNKDFNFVNDVHLSAAKRLGIKPQKNREDLERLTTRLVPIHDTHYYKVMPLTSSSAYLVPRAADFLTALGRLMQQYNGTTSRFCISSILRTQEDVKKLTRVNVNASQNSAHCYGTTFDITYNRFDIHGRTTDGQLKIDLARALYDMQAKGYCYVMYEVKQPCFHVTVRP